MSKPSFMRDLKNEPEYLPGELGFDFSFGIRGELNPKYGYYTVNQVYSYYANGTKSRSKNSMDYYQCGDQFFNYNDQAKVGLCKNSTAANSQKCASKEEIDSFLEGQTFNVAFINTYFDFNDFVSPIKYFIDDSLFWDIEVSQHKKANFYVQLQQAQLQDEFLQLGQQEEMQFHQVNNQRTYDDSYQDAEGILISIYLRYDPRYDIYNRQIYSILQLLGDIGGLQGSLYILGFLMINFLSKRILVSSILKQIYQVKDDLMTRKSQNSHNNDDVDGDRHGNQIHKISEPFSQQITTQIKPAQNQIIKPNVQQTLSLSKNGKMYHTRDNTRSNDIDIQKLKFNQDSYEQLNVQPLGLIQENEYSFDQNFNNDDNQLLQKTSAKRTEKNNPSHLQSDCRQTMEASDIFNIKNNTSKSQFQQNSKYQSQKARNQDKVSNLKFQNQIKNDQFNGQQQQNQDYGKVFQEDLTYNKDSEKRFPNKNRKAGELKNLKQIFGEEKDQSGSKVIGLSKNNYNTNLQRKLKHEEYLGDQDIDTILMNLIKRKRFNYTIKDITTYIFKCLCLRKQRNFKLNHKQHFIFQKGEKKLQDELNVVTLLKSIRQVKLLSQALLSQRQNTILKFQRKNLIETDSSSQDSDNNNKYFTTKLMESKNPMIRLVIFGKLKKMVTSYKNQKLEEIDRRLLRGLFLRNLRDFDEDQRDRNQYKSLLERLTYAMIPDSQSFLNEKSEHNWLELNKKDTKFDKYTQNKIKFESNILSLDLANSEGTINLNQSPLNHMNSSSENDKYDQKPDNGLQPHQKNKNQSIVPISQSFHFYQPSRINMQQYSQQISNINNHSGVIKNNQFSTIQLRPTPDQTQQLNLNSNNSFSGFQENSQQIQVNQNARQDGFSDPIQIQNLDERSNRKQSIIQRDGHSNAKTLILNQFSDDEDYCSVNIVQDDMQDNDDIESKMSNNENRKSEVLYEDLGIPVDLYQNTKNAGRSSQMVKNEYQKSNRKQKNSSKSENQSNSERTDRQINNSGLRQNSSTAYRNNI
eukprot:403363988